MKFIQIVPDINRSHTGNRIQDYMNITIEAVKDEFDSIDYVIFNRGKMDRTPGSIKTSARVRVISNWFDYILYLIENRNNLMFAHSRTPESLIVGLIAKRSIFMSHEGSLPKGIMKYVFQFLVKRFSVVRVTAPIDIQLLNGIGVKNIKYIPLAINTELFSPKEPDLELKKELGIKEDEKVILYVGHLRQIKRVDILMDAIIFLTHITLDKDFRYKLVMIGENQTGKELMYPDNVINLDKQSPEYISRVMSFADAGVVTSENEGQCLVAYEMACAKIPLCLSNIGSFEHTLSALFHQVEDYRLLAHNLYEVIVSRKKFEQQIEENHRLVNVLCGFEKIKKELKGMIMELELC